MELKICTKCGKNKNLGAFRTLKNNLKEFIQTWCRDCEKEYNKSYRRKIKIKQDAIQFLKNKYYLDLKFDSIIIQNQFIEENKKDELQKILKKHGGI